MKRVFIYLLAMTFIGCGVKFDSVDLNMPLPSHFKNRNLYDKTDIWRFKLTQLAGHVLHWDPESKLYERTKRIVKEGYEAELELIEESERKVYSSMVDDRISAEGSYLLFAADLDTKQTASVNIEDLSLVFINDADVPWEELIAEAKRPKSNPKIRRYWIQGVLLASVTIDFFSEISKNASGVIGETVGAKAKVYNKRGDTSRDFKLSLELVDIDRLSGKYQLLPGPRLLSLGPEEVAKRKALLEQSRVKGLVLKEIK